MTDDNFFTKRVHFRGGRSGPRWSLSMIPMLIVGVLALVGHFNVVAVVIGIVLVVAAPVLWWASTTAPEDAR